MEKRSVAKQFLRVSNKWTEILTPTEHNTFLFNSSGYPIKVHISDKAVDDPSIDSRYTTFTMGGTIAQMCIDKANYAYAKASIDDGKEAIVVASGQRIDQENQDAITTAIDNLSTQLMHLSNRVTNNQIDQLHFLGQNAIFVRQMLNSHTWMTKSFAVVNNQVLNLHNRLYAAERFVDEYRRKWISMEERVEEVLQLKGLAENIVKLENQIYETATTVNNINGTLNDLIPRVEEAWADYDKLVKEFINPLAEEVDILHQDFISLNNGITHLTDEHTPEEIEDTFQEIIRSVNSSMVPPLTGLKNALVELCLASQDNERQDASLSTKVDYSDQLLMYADDEVVNNLVNSDNEDTETPTEPEPEPEVPTE